MKGFLCFVAIVAAVYWWFGGSAFDSLLPSPKAEGPAVTHRHASADRATSPSTAPPSAAAPATDSDLERRRQLAQEQLRRIEEREAAYQRAIADYDKRRHDLAAQIESLQDSNRAGVNNGAIEALEQQRQALTLPQR